MGQAPIATTDNPLIFFDYLLLKKGIFELHDQFKSLAKEKGGYFMPAHPYTGLDDEYAYFVDFEKDNEMHSIAYGFSNFLKEKVTEEYGIAVYHLDRKVDFIHNEQDKEALIYHVISILNSYLEIADKQSYPWLLIVQEAINNLKAYASRKIEVDHYDSDNVLNYTNNRQDIFGFKLNTGSIHKLYDGLVEIGFFNAEDEQYIPFKKVLTSFDTSDKIKLMVSCSIQEAAFIFRELEPVFHNLNFKSIEQSKLFLNKKGKYISANDLSKALNTYNKKLTINPELAEETKQFIKSLLYIKR